MGTFALKITEPSLGLTDRTHYVNIGDFLNTTWRTLKNSRGEATITLYVDDGDSYAPTEGSPIFVYDGTSVVWAGTIDTLDIVWRKQAGGRTIAITAVSLEQVFDTIIVPPMGFFGAKAGAIVSALLSGICAGVPVTAGTISDGATIPSLVTEYDKTVWQVFTDLATASGFVVYVDPATSTLMFCADSTTAAPYTPASTDTLWQTDEWKESRQNYRNRQIWRVNFAAFAGSNYFTGGGGATSFTLPYLPKALVAASISGIPGSPSLASSAIGTFSAQPAPGDTITVNDAAYVFVTALDNTQEVQVLIGATLAITVANLIDAINSNPATAGAAFSLPTWENDACNASSRTSSTFNLFVKWPGQGGDGVPLAKACSHFSWSTSTTTGGATGSTTNLKVGVLGVDSTADVFYTPGSTAITTAAPVALGAVLSISYQRLGADCIQVENTANVASRAAVEHGTGKYQSLASDTQNTSAESGLLQAQQALSQFGVLLQSFAFQTRTPGLRIGQAVNFSLTTPTGIAAIINGTTWTVQEVTGTIAQGDPQPWYTVTVINAAQTQTYVQAYEQLANRQVASISAGSIGGGNTSGGGGGGATPISGPFSHGLDIFDATPVSGAGPSQTVHPGGTVVLVSGVLKLPISADLTVQLNVWSPTSPATQFAIGTFTIPASTPVNVALEFSPVNATSPVTTVTLSDFDVLTWDILSSDSSADLNGIATFEVWWQ